MRISFRLGQSTRGSLVKVLGGAESGDAITTHELEQISAIKRVDCKRHAAVAETTLEIGWPNRIWAPNLPLIHLSRLPGPSGLNIRSNCHLPGASRWHRTNRESKRYSLDGTGVEKRTGAAKS